MKILHVINSLKKGGAEGNLYRLTKFHKKKYKNKIDIIIITLIKNGYYESNLQKSGIKIFSLDINKKKNLLEIIKKIFYFRKYIKTENPDVIQSWMYHSNFITLFISRLFFHRIFWNIRHSILNFKMSKKVTIIISMICGLFTRLIPRKIIYCSDKSIKFHENNHFYEKKKTILIDNGYSNKTFYSSKYHRLNFRKKNKIKETDIILGFAGRYTVEKNIKSLLFGFSKIIKDYNNIYLCLVGKNINIHNQELMTYVKDLNIKEKIIILNEQKNLLKFYNGIDLLVLSSHAESFPNVARIEEIVTIFPELYFFIKGIQFLTVK